ncbi:glycosyltransferase involved in cell wall biosynthesis [Rhodobacter sp. 140A]|nr:glycosyltransferase involved in cell wall biosynthesis [Rhodobacter sp. 140A]
MPYERVKRGPKAVWNLARTTCAAVRDFAPDILIFHSTFSLGVMALLRALRVPGVYVYIPHGWARLRYTEAPSKARIVSAVEGRLSDFADLVLNISKNDKALAEAHGYRGRHIVIENALADLTQAPGPAPFKETAGQIDLLFIGRFDRQKGLDILLEAFPAAQARNPALHLHVVGASVLGEGNDTASNHPAITFHFWVPPERIADYYAHADMLVMPSRWEGLPMVLIEALRAGTPVMLSDTSGMGELIDPGAGGAEAGIAVPPEATDFEDALAVLTSERLATMRAHARALFETRYGPERFRAETLAALQGALSKGKANLTEEGTQ